MNRRNFIGKLTAALAVAPAFVKAEPKKGLPPIPTEHMEQHRDNMEKRMTATECVQPYRGRGTDPLDDFVRGMAIHHHKLIDDVIIKALK